MHIAKLYLKSISSKDEGFLTFKTGTKYKRADVIKRNISRSKSNEFENIPTSGWKISSNSFTPTGNSYSEERGLFLTHPTNDEIFFLVDDIGDKLDKLTIVKGVIQEEILFTFNGTLVGIVTPEEQQFQTALTILDNERNGIKVTPRNLSCGDVIIYDSRDMYQELIESVFLGSYFLSKGRIPYSGKNVAFSETPKKVHLLFETFKEYDDDCEDENSNELCYRLVTATTLKDINVIGFKDGLEHISYPDVLNEPVFNCDIELFRPLCGEKIFEYTSCAKFFSNFKDVITESEAIKAIKNAHGKNKKIDFIPTYNGNDTISSDELVCS